MVNDTSDVHGGVKIVPSARKSIHSHCNSCELDSANMGKHGLPKRREKKPEPVQGVDEIDNVMSKMCRQASPIPTRKTRNVTCRRNSLDNYSTDDSDEDEENVLSKSSPSTFSFSSEDLYTSALQNESQRSRNESYSNNSYSANNISSHRRQNTSIDDYNGRITMQHQSNSELNNSKNIVKIMTTVIIIFLGVIARKQFGSYDSVNQDSANVYDKLRFDSDVRGLKEKYRITDNSILQVRTGIATIFENQDTASFIFAYNSQKDGFNLLKFNNFIDDIASTASKYLRNESNEIHTTVDTSNLIMRTEKEFMNFYRDEVTKSGVMLVKDIDNVPSQLAMAFHYYCDEYNPLVKQSAIFFTLNLANCSNNAEKKSTHAYIEKCLAKKWNTVDQEKIIPLLTRVVNIVIDVTQTF